MASNAHACLVGSRRDDVTGGDNLGRPDCVGMVCPVLFHKFHLVVVFRFSLLSSQLRSQRINCQG